MDFDKIYRENTNKAECAADAIKTVTPYFMELVDECEEENFDLRAKWTNITFICIRDVTEDERDTTCDELVCAIERVKLPKIPKGFVPLGFLVEYQAQEGNPRKLFMGKLANNNVLKDLDGFGYPVFFDVRSRDNAPQYDEIVDAVRKYLLDTGKVEDESDFWREDLYCYDDNYREPFPLF